MVIEHPNIKKGRSKAALYKFYSSLILCLVIVAFDENDCDFGYWISPVINIGRKNTNAVYATIDMYITFTIYSW